jgi:hypothetical protein
MRWKLTEIFYELANDPDRSILFVEGSRDVIFWKELVPTIERENCMICPISTIECEPVTGGERGRLIWCAGEFERKQLSDRVIFFVDADCDALLGSFCLKNVVLTDGRDLECYGLTSKCITRLSTVGFGKNEKEAAKIFEWVTRVNRPIGLLRLVSARAQLNNNDHLSSLPFQKTLETKSLSRFLEGKRISSSLNVMKLVKTLLQNGNISLNLEDELISLLKHEEKNHLVVCHHKIIHGKDFVRSLSYIFDIDEKGANAVLFSNIDYPEIKKLPNINSIMGWVEKRRITAPVLETEAHSGSYH